MAEKTKVKLHLPGFYALRTSPEMQALLDKHAGAIQSRAGANYKHSVHVGAKTAVARIYPAGAAGIREERKHASLSKAVGGW